MKTVAKYSRLFKPLRLGRIELPNRIVMPAMFTALGSGNAQVTPRLTAFLEARARGGAGLIVVETSCIHREGRVFAKHLDVGDDRFIPGLSEIPPVIHQHGAMAALQISHAGRNANQKLTGTLPVAPSAIPTPGIYNVSGGTATRELTVAGIAEIVGHYAAAARRARQAGFDMVEIYGPPNGLVGQFLCRASNQRGDSYGGDTRGRARFLVEVIRALKTTLGESYPVSIRLLGMDEARVTDGITIKEAQETARLAQDAGADMIHLYATSSGYPCPLEEQPLTAPLLEYLAGEIKQAVTVPVVAVGAINSEAGENILKEGKADLVSMGKALIADPDLPQKVASGRQSDVNPCIACLNCLETAAYRGSPLECSVNAEAGFEMERCIEPAVEPKRIIVVGAGAAGMEAARVAALRGYQVSLYDRGSELGGRLIEAAVPPHKDGIRSLIRYFEAQLKQLGIKVELGQLVTATLVETAAPDAVILATGATPRIPEIPGVNGDNVITALECLTGHRRVGASAVVVGGGLIGCETALYIAQQGKKVTVLEMLDEIGLDIGPAMRPITAARLKAAGIQTETGVKAVEINATGIDGLRNNAHQFFVAATVVLAVGMQRENALAESLGGKVKELYLAGDCVEPRRIKEAIHEGYLVACGL